MDPVKEEPKFATLEGSGKSYSVYLISPERDYIQKMMADSGSPYELSMLEDMKEHLQKGQLVLDIGANIGNHTFYLANVAECKVIAFEANSELARAMENTISHSGIGERVSVHPVALGEREEVADFAALTPENLGGQSLRLGVGSIPVRTLDSFEISTKVDAIKIDVEGMELSVLKGGRELIERDHPLLYVECMNFEAFQAVSEYLFDFGYKYSATFNATPTHLFTHSESDAAEDSEHNVRLANVESNYLTLENSRLKRDLNACRLKYRASSAANKTFADETVKLRESLNVAIEGRARMKQKYKSEKKENKALMLQYEGLHAQLHTDNSNASVSGEDSQERELNDQLRLENNHLTEQLQQNLQQIDDLSIRYEDIKKSLTEQETENNVLSERNANLVKEFAVLSSESNDVVGKIERMKLDLKIAHDEREIESKNIQLVEQSLRELREKYEEAIRHADKLESQLVLTEQEGRNLANIVSGLKSDIARLEKEKQSIQSSANEMQALHQQALDNIKNKYLLMMKNVRDLQAQIREDASKQILTLVQQRMSGLSAVSAYDKQATSLISYRGELETLINSRTTELKPQSDNGLDIVEKKRNSLQYLGHKLTVFNKLREPSVWEKVQTNKNKKIKVACIMDDFTYHSYKEECQLKQLSLGFYMEELEAFQPEMLFLESAWRGKDEEWGSRVGHRSKEIMDIITWCKKRDIPTIFWNKEDPIHFETFLNLAKLIDYIFTTDIDCIARYKAALNHQNVFFLPFACQPVVHNPIEKYQRKDAFCFAGAYYVRYPDRTKDLENFVQEFPSYADFEIYDRNFGKDMPDYMFPDSYKPYIVGTLPFSEIDKAYKGYKYAINLNSIKQSQTMFARRVYELLASNTLTVSNFSRGVRLMFGDLVVSTDSGVEALRRLKDIDSSDLKSRKIRLAALRKVLSEHTYEKRFAYVVSKAFDRQLANIDIHINVYGIAKSVAEADKLKAAFGRQTYSAATLFIVQEHDVSDAVSDTRMQHLDFQQFASVLADVDNHLLQWSAIFSPEDYYGPNYLLDLALATKYSTANIIGKSAYYENIDQNLVLKNSDTIYTPHAEFVARRCLFRTYHLQSTFNGEISQSLSDLQFTTDQGMAIDEFNYAHNGVGMGSRQLSEINDLEDIHCGWSIDSLTNAAEVMQPDRGDISSESGSIPGDEFYKIFGKPSDKITSVLDGSVWIITSHLPDGKHEYCYATTDLTLQESGFDKVPQFHLETTPGLNVQVVVLYLNEQKQRISHEIKYANRNNNLLIPENTAYIRYGLRFYASGSCQIERMIVGHKQLKPAELFSTSKHLVLTNHYPSYSDLYRNGFVHSRLAGYRAEGLDADVFRLRMEQSVSYHEFEGIDVITGSAEALHRALASGRYKSVLVHFMDSDMWSVLKDYLDTIKVTVWVHGAEIQVWQRRAFEFESMSEKEIERQKELSDKRRMFWRSVLENPHRNLKLVFVSQYFAEEVSQDLDIDLSTLDYEIVHNFVDKNVFPYSAKTENHRKRLLSIRPYASRKYANDMTVNAILELSTRDFFDDLDIALYGDGPLFDELTAPLSQFSNVTLEKRFLSHKEISTIHKEYGIFITPTRMDSQGVSRDEAMSSGLVPITTAVTAIPEFVDAECGFLVEGEDYLGMADAIEHLYRNPESFLSLSKSASERANRQSGFEQTILKETQIIKATEESFLN